MVAAIEIQALVYGKETDILLIWIGHKEMRFVLTLSNNIAFAIFRIAYGKL
jgi:hypothetical protein